MIIDVYPSQDNPTNQTLWIFSGSSTVGDSNGIRTFTTNYNVRDTWQFRSSFNNGNFYNANKPSDTNFQLSPLFSSSNPKDIASVNARIPGGGKTNITFAANAANTPTITIGSGVEIISYLFMNESPGSSDHFGIRTDMSLSYAQNEASSWSGAGIINKPIGDFFAGTFNNYGSGILSGPHFAAASDGSVRIVVNRQVIPEPKEYALVFGLFALGFVILRRHFQKKRQASHSR